MFSDLHRPVSWFLPKLELGLWFGRRRPTHQNHVHLDEMPDSLKRDLGLLDGRSRRGFAQHDASSAWQLMEWRRNL